MISPSSCSRFARFLYIEEIKKFIIEVIGFLASFLMLLRSVYECALVALTENHKMFIKVKLIKQKLSV